MHPLIRRQLRKAFPAGVPDGPEIAALAAAVGEAYAACEDDRAQLERSLELATTELVGRNQAMTLILDHVGQGLVTVGFDGLLGGQASRALHAWFGPPAAGVTLWDYLFGHEPELAAWLQLGFDSLRTDLMPPEVVLAQLVRRLERDGRQYRLEYLPIGAPPARLLVVVSDITDELALQRAERAQAEVIAVIERATRDRHGFASFVRETDRLLAAASAAAVTPADLRRHLHTLKGNFGLFGLGGLAALCHQLETELVDVDAACVPSAVAPIAAGWQALHDRVAGLLGLSGPRTLVVDWGEYQTVLTAIDDSDGPWAARVRRWGLEPVRAHLERIGEQARQLADRLGKPELAVVITDDGTRIDGDRFGPLWSALVHTVRNAVDHGIEPPDARLAVGKSAHGELALRGVRRGADLVIEIGDDGAGVDWAAVAAAATARGLPHATAAELHAALCADGLSTAATADELSGRGVGLAAVRAACVELGGRLELDSARGRGTVVRCVAPLEPPRATNLHAAAG